MAIQSDFLGIKELKLLSPRRRAELHRALEDLVTSDVDLQAQALDRLSKMDAHRRSPLAVAFLGCRIIEPNISIRAEIVCLLAAALKVNEGAERSPPKVLENLHNVLCQMGAREVQCLLELIAQDNSLLDPVCAIHDQCSASGEILVDMVTQHDLDFSIRVAAADVIAQVGFLEAKQPVEILERRLVNRTSGQLVMSFASQTLEEAEKLIPVLRRTLVALEEAGF